MEHRCFCSTLDASRRPFLGQALLRTRVFPKSQSLVSSRIFCRRNSIKNGGKYGNGGSGVGKPKENIWSQENEMACYAEEKKMVKGREGGRRKAMRKRRGSNSRVLVSSPMLTKVDAVLQTQEPFVKPVWNTFACNVCGIWKGVGAVFSPSTAEMEPIAIGKKNENLYDCYTLSCVQNLDFSATHLPQIHRKTNWVTLNPFGENKHNSIRDENHKDKNGIMLPSVGCKLPSYEYFDFSSSDVLEEDFLTMESGLLFFEDGSFSRGPIEIPLSNESKYFLSPTFKFEQCLVQGCHKRLRIVYTIEFSDGGSHIQIIRVAVFEEEWVRPSNLDDDGSDAKLNLKSFSQRKRTQQSELAGSWKVFEKNATPIFNGDNDDDESGNEDNDDKRPPYVYLCTETLIKRDFPGNRQAYFGKEEMLETILWLPGGITGYVNVNNDGILCIGVGWLSEDGINLVMERDYGINGKLEEVRWKSELKKKK